VSGSLGYYTPQSAGFDHDAAAPFWIAPTIGHAMGLTEDQLTDAQRIAGMLGLTTNQSACGTLTDWRHCTYAASAVKGLQAVRLAMAGFQGPSEIYEGEEGVDKFFPHTGTLFDPPPDLSRIVFKRWPAFTFCQTPIDVALELSEKIPNPGAVTSIDVCTYSLALKYGATSSSSHPETRAGRTHSIPYCVAAALIKPIEYDDFNDLYSKNKTLSSLIPKVKVTEDPEMTKAFPSKSQCSIKVTLEDGTTLNGSRDYPKGDPLDPLSDSELEDKFRKNYFPDGTDAEKDEIIHCIWNMEQEKNLNRLLNPLKRGRI
ncbi:MAG: MmgE/PrpD family protein, partial [Candidatus Sabulitectum sp.]|nr:MmgE/PrpD family protein [Candidatus Sabulitectum sp.]